MEYPTITEIEVADRIQIARWWRYLPSPGANHLNSDNFVEECQHEAALMDRINERFESMGGMTPELSKIIRH